MEPTIYKPSIYKGAGIYKNGAGGGGNNGIKIFTDFSQYNENDRTDYPIIGTAANPFDSIYTITKEKYALKLVAPNNDSASATSPYVFDIDYSKIYISFKISKPTSTYSNSIIWTRKRGVLLSYLGDLEVIVDNNLNFITPLTLEEDTGTYSKYYTGLNTNSTIGAVMQQIVTNDGYIEIYINDIYCGKFLKSLINNTTDYISPSPRWNSKLDIYSLFVI